MIEPGASLLRGFVLRLLDDGELARRLEQSPTPALTTDLVLQGPDPLRVLLVGSGVGVGYGVTTQAEALSGRLADCIRSRTERGVQLSSLARHGERMAATLTGPASTLEGTSEGRRGGSDGVQVVVYTPDLAEVLNGSRLQWRRQIRRLVARSIKETVQPRRIVLTAVPAPRVATTMSRIMIRQCAAFNDELRRAAARDPRDLRYEPAHSYPSMHAHRLFDADYYERTAASICSSLSSR